MNKNNVLQHLLLGVFLLIFSTASVAQNTILRANGAMNDGDSHWNNDTDTVKTENVPIGLYVWKINPRFGDIIKAEPDTLPHLFQNEAFTGGTTGHYNYTGNLGSPRNSRILSDNLEHTFSPQFIFAKPYDYFLTPISDLLFTNTKSPITNITYHECGNKQNGEDRIRALFATNAGKRFGAGFKLDYLYGRGYYQSQSTAHFNGTLFASYISDTYNLHTAYSANHLKNSENGGIESDDYVTRPETFPTKYGTADMPTRLSKSWNKMNVNTFYLTHNYNLGFTRHRDKDGHIVNARQFAPKNKLLSKVVKNAGMPADTTRRDSMPTSDANAKLVSATQTAAKDMEAAEDTLSKVIPEFVPVVGFIHTMRLEHNNRRFLSNLTRAAGADRYFNDFYLPGDSANDYTKNIHVENTLALELREGFNRWVKSGLRLFVRHDFYKYTLPDQQRLETRYTENYFTIGAQLFSKQSRLFHYDLLGELRNTGKSWGEFNVSANVGLAIPLHSDTLKVNLFGNTRGEQPTFYQRTYHARNAWWDKSYDRTFSASAGGTIAYKRTRLSVALQTLQNHAYFQERLTPVTTSEGTTLFRSGVEALQKGKNIQALSASLRQDLTWGILNWENELTAQTTSEKEILPLPAFSVWSNLYLRFRIAHVLLTEFGADARFFTAYKALTYSPLIGSYVVQDPDHATKTGNYPWVNVYANFHLKSTRFYIMASHVNYKSGSGKPFLVPHYPLNQMVLRLGISWNFFN